MKRFAIICLALLIPTLHAKEEAPEVSDQCVSCIRNVYRFYYHSVQPNANPACHTNKKMGEKETAEMQAIIAELRNHCPAYLIAQVNQSLVQDKSVG